MVQFRQKIDHLILRDEFCWMRILPKNFALETRPGMPISLFPVSGVVSGIRTKGLKYTLENESLQNGVRDGSSNESIETLVEISHVDGDLLLMVFDNWDSADV